jgi:phosphate transport system substrate-binding protein
MNYLVSFILVFALLSCGNYDTSKEGISSGALKLGVDESYSLMMDSQIFTFTKLYENARIDAQFLAEGDILELLLKDSIQCAVISRTLTKQEEEVFTSKNRFPESVKIAVDGLALIVHPDNPDTVFTMDRLKALFQGQVPSWEQWGGKNKGEMKVIFDHARSCNARMVQEKFTEGQPFPDYCFAVNKNQEVVEYVSTHPNAIGLISVSWISDEEDPLSQAFLSKIKVAAIIDPSHPKDPSKAWKPYQAYIADGNYPLLRDVYAIRTGTRGSLGTGFVSYLAGEKGQLIIYKMGMYPANAVTRLVRISE